MSRFRTPARIPGWTAAVATLAIVFLVQARVSPAQQSAEQEAIAIAWVEAFNSHDRDTMFEFRSRHFQRTEVTDWEGRFLRLVDRLGRIEIMGVFVDQSNQVGLSVSSEKRGQIRMRFVFFEETPDQIREIRLGQGGSGPGRGSQLPALHFSSGNWRTRSAELETYLRELAEKDVFSGTVMVVERGDVHFEGAYGLASREFEVPNTLDTRFDVGSFNKDYTRLGIAQLESQGKLSRDDLVGTHLPGYPNKDVRERVTIDHLLEHRSGLGDYFTPEYHETPMGKLREIEDYIPIWGPKPLEFEPGTRESYSNLGYTVLGAIIEEVSGLRYDEYVERNIFEPAGMVDTGFFETDRPEPRVAVGYTKMGPDMAPSETFRKNIYMEPAKGGPWGKSYSTVRDLYRFFEALFDDRLIPLEYNWMRAKWDSGSMLAGGGPGLNAAMSLERGFMVLVCANLDPPIATGVASMIQRAHERYAADRKTSRSQ